MTKYYDASPITSFGNWTASGTVNGFYNYITMHSTAVITNATNVASSVIKSSYEIQCASAFDGTGSDLVLTFENYDGTYSYKIKYYEDGVIKDNAGNTIGNYKYPGADTKFKTRVTCNSTGEIFVYMDDVLIPNASLGVDADTTTAGTVLKSGTSTDKTYIYYIYGNDQVLDPSDPLPDSTYSGGTLYCTNDDVRTAGDSTFYKWSHQEGGVDTESSTTFNLQLDWGFKIKELEKRTVAGGLINQLKQVKFVPSTGQFSYMEPKFFTMGDALISTDFIKVYTQTHNTDDDINKARREIQAMVDKVLRSWTSPPLTPSTLYDQVVYITANLTKLRLIKDAGLRNKGDWSEVQRQWKEYMDELDDLSLGTVTLNGVAAATTQSTTLGVVPWQQYNKSNKDRRRSYYDAGG